MGLNYPTACSDCFHKDDCDISWQWAVFGAHKLDDPCEMKETKEQYEKRMEEVRSNALEKEKI